MNRNIMIKPTQNTTPYPAMDSENQKCSEKDGFRTSYFTVLTVMCLIAAVFASCGPSTKEPLSEAIFNSVEALSADELRIAEGFTSQVLVSSMDSIGKETRFGYDVSGLAYAGEDTGEGILWVNHELIKPMFTSGYYGDIARLRSQVELEQAAVGATALKVYRDGDDWAYKVSDDAHSRISASAPIQLDKPVQEKESARGTVANKAVVYTSWGTFLSAEAGYEQYYGDYEFISGNYNAGIFRWASFFRDDPRLYGWIVETDPKTGRSKKLTDLGRVRRNGMAMEQSGSQIKVYFTSRGEDGFLFRYISQEGKWPEEGTLWVANLNLGKWVPLTLDNPVLGRLFEDKLQLQVNLEEAARAVDATTFDSPGGLVASPAEGVLYVTTANDLNTQNYHGSVMLITSAGDSITWDTIVEGGEQSGVSCPAELQLDQQGNLWIATAIPSQLMNKGVYTSFGNNALFVLPKGETNPVRIATGPVDARFGGLSFADGDQFLFVSVQQPGALSKSIWDFDFTSHWPAGGQSMPRSSVIVLSRE